MYNNKKNPHPASIRKSEATPLGQVINEMFDAYHLNRKVDQTQVVNLWPKLMGKAIASRTKGVFMKENKLFVTVESSALKQELLMSKERIIHLFRQELGKEIVKEIVLL
jgi:predicted nucleic acid-binding Zn ribbon protein